MERRAEAGALLAVAGRALLALVAVLLYLVARPRLDPGALAAARFGLGILLFALLVDLGRAFAGTGRPLEGPLGRHRQRASPQVDEAYQRLRSAVEAYVDHGTIEEPLKDGIEQAADARGLADEGLQRLHEPLRQTAGGARGDRSLLAVRLLSGGVLALGAGLAAATLAELLAMAVVPPVLLVTGTSIATLQWRARVSGARWTGLLVGLAGVGVFGLGALQILAASPPVGLLLLAVAALAGLATVAATLRHPADPRGPTDADLEATLTRLRRAFLVTLLSALVLFALQPVLTATTSATLSAALDVAAILVATVGTFLALEGAGTWLCRARRRRRGDRRRAERREAIDAVLEELDHAGSSAAGREKPT